MVKIQVPQNVARLHVDDDEDDETHLVLIWQSSSQNDSDDS